MRKSYCYVAEESNSSICITEFPRYNANAARAGNTNGILTTIVFKGDIMADENSNNHPESFPRPKMSGIQFLESLPETDDCIMWPFHVDKKGYGYVKVNKKHIAAHRYSLMLRIQPDSPSLWALHTCDVPGCVNNRHLYWGDSDQNIRDKLERKRETRGEASHWAVLTEVQVREAIRLRIEGELSQKEIAAKLGASFPAVSQALAGKSWRRVREEMGFVPPKKRIHKPKSLTKDVVDRLLSLRESGMYVMDICRELSIGKTTYYRAVRRAQQRQPPTLPG